MHAHSEIENFMLQNFFYAFEAHLLCEFKKCFISLL